MFRRHILLTLLALSSLTVAATLPFVNTANANHTTGFGLRLNLMIDNDATPLLNAAQIMRVDWLAQDVKWKDIEPQAGQYKWEKMDAMITAVRPHGFQLLLSVYGTPDWARIARSDPTRDAPPANPATFARFMSAMLTRYNGLVGAVEIYPESNLGARWSSPDGISPERYVELLKPAYTAIHAADPLVIVIGGSLAPTASNDGKIAIDDLVYYKRMYKAGAANYFDALGVRVDGHNNPPKDFTNSKSVESTTYKNKSPFYYRHYEDVYAMMVENGDKDKKLWITSAGWASSTEKVVGKEFALDVTEQKQAEYLVGAIELAQSQPYVAALIINNFNYSTSFESDPSSLYSLIRPDWSARPALLKLAQARQEAASFTSNNSVPQYILPNWRPRQRPTFGSQP
ncbi:MAG: hypothetical protein HZC38_10340 [Chloroflexi bacterium]|nr:hypothetical protein [Chloroflexota bacterium]